MPVAALIAWIVAAIGGFYLLATWIRRGGVRPGGTANSNFPPALIFTHFGLAATGLVLWLIYVATHTTALAWTSFGVLVIVAALGFTMLSRWVPVVRGRGSTSNPGGDLMGDLPAEGHLPIPAVVAHGLVAVTTLVLVLLGAAGVGGR